MFSDQQDVEKVYRFFRRTMLKRLWHMLKKNVCKCLKRKARVGPRFLRDKRPVVERAPEPLDVFWENLGLLTKHKTKRSFATYAATLFVLAVFGAISFGIRTLKERAENDSSSSN